jgi:hypothetical protein
LFGIKLNLGIVLPDLGNIFCVFSTHTPLQEFPHEAVQTARLFPPFGFLGFDLHMMLRRHSAVMLGRKMSLHFTSVYRFFRVTLSLRKGELLNPEASSVPYD